MVNVHTSNPVIAKLIFVLENDHFKEILLDFERQWQKVK